MSLQMRFGASWIGAALLWVGVSMAQAAEPFEELTDALRLSETAHVLSDGGVAYGVDLGAQMLPDGGGAGWPGRLARIYDPDRMEVLIRDRLSVELTGEDLGPLVAFFASDLGQEVISLELAAREAFNDISVEEAAREKFMDLSHDDARIVRQINELIEDSDLVTFNVMGILNSNLTLYRGLVDGKALEMTEDDILRDVWAQEEAVREDSLNWLQAYFLVAYQGLDADDLDRYVAFWKSDAGRVFNRVSFAVYDRVYEELSYLLGRAVADQMFSQDL